MPPGLRLIPLTKSQKILTINQPKAGCPDGVCFLGRRQARVWVANLQPVAAIDGAIVVVPDEFSMSKTSYVDGVGVL